MGKAQDAPAARGGRPQQVLKSPAVIGADNPVSSTSPKTIENQYRLAMGPARLRLELDDQQPLTMKGGMLERRGRLPFTRPSCISPSSRGECPMANGR